jgi:hypothetical protein
MKEGLKRDKISFLFNRSNIYKSKQIYIVANKTYNIIFIIKITNETFLTIN